MMVSTAAGVVLYPMSASRYSSGRRRRLIRRAVSIGNSRMASRVLWGKALIDN